MTETGERRPRPAQGVAPPLCNEGKANKSDRRWGIVGGGVMGMALALKLASRGEKVELMEASDRLGGLTSPWQLGDIVWDRFYHVIVNVDQHLLALLEDLSLLDQIKWVETRAGFYAGGCLHSMSTSLDFLRFKPLSLYQKFRLGSTILYGSRFGEWKELEKIPVERWLRRVSGDSTFEAIWLPLLKAKLGDEYKRTSAAFIWAYIRRMYSARQNGLKREQFGYVPGGYQTILSALELRLRALGVKVRTHAVTERLEGLPGGGIEVRFDSGERKQFTHVVSTLPPKVTSRLCPALSVQEHRLSGDIDYIGVVCPSLLLSQPLSSYYVTNLLEPWIPFTGIIEMTTVVDPSEFGGQTLVYLPKYVSQGDEEAFAESEASIRERCLGVLERMYPHFDRESVLAFQVARATQVMALPTLGYSQALPPQKTTVEGLFAINSASIIDGVLNVDSTLSVANRAFDELLQPVVSG